MYVDCGKEPLVKLVSEVCVLVLGGAKGDGAGVGIAGRDGDGGDVVGIGGAGDVGLLEVVDGLED